jgi:glucose-6-phosphate 1-epimerase
VTVVAGANGLPKVVLRAADGATAEVYLQGAHVASWRPAPGTEERLFVSARSRFAPGAAIRGGIPVIFPQFAAEGPLPRHGFARTAQWSLTQFDQGAANASATFELEASDETRQVWPAEFRSILRVEAGGDQLLVQLRVENRGASSLSFTGALHTYLAVSDADNLSLTGLRGVRYRESGAPSELTVDLESSIGLSREIDRVYVGAPSPLVLREPGRELVIDTSGFPDVVVWNPGAARASKLDDMEPNGERRMICVEAAAVQEPIVLAAGEQWSGAQILEASRPRESSSPREPAA